MQRSRRIGVLSALLLLLSLARVEAHEDKDPVCGMMVEIEKAHAKEMYAGQTFYFCSASCRSAFLANAEKFVGALRVFKMHGRYAVAMTARPRVPKPGDLVRFLLQVGTPEEGGMIPDAKTALPLRRGVAHVYLLDRGSPPAPEIHLLHETEDPGAFGFSKLIEAEGAYRIYFEAEYPDGTRITAGLDCLTPGAIPADDHHGIGTAGPAPAAGPHSDTAGHTSSLSMAAQHDTMKRMGAHWLAFGKALDRGLPPESVLGSLDEIRRWAANMPQFQLHKFPDQKQEYDRLTTAFLARLDLLEGEIRRGPVEQARSAYADVDAKSCLKCHLKYRWGAVADLGRFPDLSGQP